MRYSVTLILVPCNVGFHWILTVIGPHKEAVSLFDPLSHRNRDEDWKKVVNVALKRFNMEKGKKGKKQPTWNVIKAPRQPDDQQCGFFIMRYMRQIVKELTDSSSLRAIFTQANYFRGDIDEVRSE